MTKLVVTEAPVQRLNETRSQSVRTLSSGILCAGCHRLFIPTRRHQRHCRPACRKLAQRDADASRLAALMERLDPGDPGRPE